MPLMRLGPSPRSFAADAYVRLNRLYKGGDAVISAD
jgi:hypothetical protein